MRRGSTNTVYRFTRPRPRSSASVSSARRWMPSVRRPRPLARGDRSALPRRDWLLLRTTRRRRTRVDTFAGGDDRRCQGVHGCEDTVHEDNRREGVAFDFSLAQDMLHDCMVADVPPVASCIACISACNEHNEHLFSHISFLCSRLHLCMIMFSWFRSPLCLLL